MTVLLAAAISSVPWVALALVRVHAHRDPVYRHQAHLEALRKAVGR